MNTVKEVTDETFEMEVLKSGTPCLVDFWAIWCQPCKAIEPTLEQLHKTYEGRVAFKKLDVEQNPVTPGRFGIRSIPALLFISQGNVARILIGSQPQSVIEDALNDMLEE
jgi:thioredoxin 1